MLNTALTLPDLFTAQAAATPALSALEDERGLLSYAELESLTRRWAHDLIGQCGVGKDTLVGIFMPRCKEYVVAALAAMRAGGAFLVLEMAYPDKLLQQVLADAQPKVVLTLASESARIPSHIPKIEMDTAQPKAGAVGVQLPHTSLEQLAFVSYSSGTTGKPKGIANPHRAAVGSYALRFALSDLRPGDRVGCNVFFIWEMLRPLLRGATTVVVPDARSYDPEGLLAFLQSAHITETLMTPTLLATLLAHNSRDHTLPLPALRTLWLNGEVVTLDLAQRAAKALPHVRLLNVYSISETHEVAAGDISKMIQSPDVVGRSFCPVGPLLDSAHVYILKEDSLDPVGAGEAGELCVSGPLLARGYLNLPQQTAKAFVPAPQGDGKMYRTGDLARLLPSGAVEITGRIGGMIKTRGYTVHPSAVQAAVVAHLGVQACTVVGHGEGVEKRLVAYIVPDPLRVEPVPVIEPSGHSPQANKLLQPHLAQYMIPTLWVEVTQLPTHAVSGKIDLASLPSPPPSTRPSTRPTSPGSQSDAPALGAQQVKEDTLVDLWSLVLGVPSHTVRAGHSFFELGGHSLLLADLAGRLSRASGFTVPLGALAADPSLAGHLRAVTAARDGHLAELQADLPKVMRDDCILPPDVRPNSDAPTASLKGTGKHILLTGATGYLGAFLLRALAARTPDDVKIICLIRFPYPTEYCTPAGLARIRANLNDLGLWTDDLLDRIEVVPGNLPQSHLGLELTAFTALAHRVRTVIHAAAAVNLVYPYAALRAANVGGTREILRLCALGGATLHHISTNGALPPGKWDEYTHIPLDKAVRSIPDGYGQTKWVAEQLVRESQSRGLNAHIYRLGTLGGCSETGASNPYDMLDAVLIEALRMQVAPTLPEWSIELTPVNHVADAVAALATAAETSKTLPLYHLGNPAPPSAEHVFDTLAQLGYPTSRVPFAQWQEQWTATLASDNDPNKQTPFTTEILKGGFPSPDALCAVPILLDAHTQAVLDKLIPDARPRVDAHLWRTYTRHFYARGWLPHGPAGRPVPREKAKERRGRLAGKVAVVTGASSGIGAAVARTLAREGAAVSLAARRVDALEALRAEIVEANTDARVLVSQTDVTSHASVDALVKGTEAALGPIDVLVSCAGVMYFTLMSNALMDQWDQTVDVNCKGLLHCLGSVVPSMLARGTGHVVAISSDAGRKTFAGLGVYSASKFFVEATMQALRLETASSGLRVTSIQPGNVSTPLLGMSTDQDALTAYGTPSGARVLDPQDVAASILYALTQPHHVAVNEILVEPREEPI